VMAISYLEYKNNPGFLCKGSRQANMHHISTNTVATATFT